MHFGPIYQKGKQSTLGKAQEALLSKGFFPCTLKASDPLISQTNKLRLK